MDYRYYEYKSTENLPLDEANANRDYNNTILRNGMAGVACKDVRPATLGEKIDYMSYIPYGCHVSYIEIYENGAVNVFVRNALECVVGVLIFRPLTKQ